MVQQNVPPLQQSAGQQYFFPVNEYPSQYQRQRRHSFQQARPAPLYASQQEPQPQPPRSVPPRQRSLERTPFSSTSRDRESRSFFKELARSTIEAINNGIVDVSNAKHDTRFYHEDAPQLAHWRSKKRSVQNSQSAEINILPMSTLKGARFLYSQHPRRKIGILNFASATSPGGGFLSGARAQEESIARASTLYVSLVTSTAREFYSQHAKDDRGGFYTHSMIYSPDVHLLRDDDGDWLTPLLVDIVTSPAVNAGVVRKNSRRRSWEVETEIYDVMRERMGRILALFERKNARQLVLGSFGTGVFQNDVSAMAKIWHDLLRAPGAPFAYSFDHVVFAIPDINTQQKFAQGFDPAMVSAGAPWIV